MAAPIAPVVRMSAEEFYARYAHDDLAKRYELVDGEVVPVSPANPRQDRVAINLIKRIEAYAEPRALGWCTAGQGGFKLDVPGRRGDTVRAPDVGFIVTERLRPLMPPTGFGRGAPDLAVEVRSPTDRTRDILARRDDMFAGGARLFWDVDPRRRTVAAYVPDGGAAHLLGPDDALDGGDVLPGFSVRVADLFAGLPDLDT